MRITRLSRNTAAVLAISAVAVGGSASIASAKTVKFKVTCVSKIVGAGTTSDACTSAALGKGTGKSVLIAPNYKGTEKFAKGGTFVFKGKSKVGTDGSNNVKGTFKVTKGKYKGGKGTFKATAGLKNGIVSVSFSGTLKTK